MYVKHSAALWLVNFNLRLAMLALPSHEWRIIESNFYCTVWNGHNLLFDLDWYGNGRIPAKQCFAVAYGEEYTPGEYIEVDLPLHYSWEEERRRQERNRTRDDAQEMAEKGPNPYSDSQRCGATVIPFGRAGI
jgi:hypothetical protein